MPGLFFPGCPASDGVRRVPPAIGSPRAHRARGARSSGAGSDVAVTALKSTVAATTAAFDQFSKATKQVVSFADASMRAAANNAANATKPAAKGRKAA